jgi:hypothetical protein
MKRINNFESLTKKQKIRIIKDVVMRGPFLKKSADIKFHPETIGKFFNEKIYKKLKGNDILGYQFDDGFSGESATVCLKILKFFNGAKKFRGDFLKAVDKVFQKYGIKKSKKSNIELGIALLDVEPEKSERSLPGCMIEYYLKNRKTGKFFFHRLGTGNSRGIKFAFYEIAIVIVNFLGV